MKQQGNHNTQQSNETGSPIPSTTKTHHHIARRKRNSNQENVKNQNLMKVMKPNHIQPNPKMYNLTDPFVKDSNLRKTRSSETGDRQANNHISHQFANKNHG